MCAFEGASKFERISSVLNNMNMLNLYYYRRKFVVFCFMHNDHSIRNHGKINCGSPNRFFLS